MPKPTPSETPKLRHSGLDPESRIVKLRREAPQKLIDELDSGSSPE
jgi:hypothetical protein